MIRSTEQRLEMMTDMFFKLVHHLPLSILAEKLAVDITFEAANNDTAIILDTVEYLADYVKKHYPNASHDRIDASLNAFQRFVADVPSEGGIA